jgi:alkylation response protein AidB-like acyl-CoA dehydrogenase
MNAERCLLAGEALGLGYVALEKAVKYSRERVVFGRPIGQNQGIQHPLAAAFMNLEAAKLATYHATRLYDDSLKDRSIPQHTVGIACNSAKYLAAEAAFTACERAVRLLCLVILSCSLTSIGPLSRWNGIRTGISCRALPARVFRAPSRASESSRY